MTQELNNYTIDDFVKLKPIIYEYCINLTQKKGESFWYRDFNDANDLYQETFLYVHDRYFNKPKSEMTEGKFIQIMKNCTYWTFHKKKFQVKNSKLYLNLNRFDDSPKDLFLFEQSNYEQAKPYVNFKESLDYNFYIKDLNSEERKAIDMYLIGYPIKEIDKTLNKYVGWFEALVRNKVRKTTKLDIVRKSKPIKVKQTIKLEPRELKKDNVLFLKSKIKNYDQVFNFKRANDKWIKLYSLYLQGVSITEISKIFKSSKAQISVELYRIKQKIKKYASE